MNEPLPPLMAVCYYPSLSDLPQKDGLPHRSGYLPSVRPAQALRGRLERRTNKRTEKFPFVLNQASFFLCKVRGQSEYRMRLSTDMILLSARSTCEYRTHCPSGDTAKDGPVLQIRWSSGKVTVVDNAWVVKSRHSTRGG